MTQSKLESLISWAKSKGAELDPSFEFQLISDAKGHGAVALEDLSTPDGQNVNVIFSTPLSIEISSNNIRDDPYFQEVATYRDKLTKTELVILALCIERRKEEDSEYWPYIDYLPKELHLGRLDVDLREFPVDMRKEYLMDCIAKKKSIQHVERSSKNISILEIAYDTVHSRSLIDEDNVTLQPVADLFNASQNPQVALKTQPSVETDRQRKYYNLGILTKEVKKGDELTINYDTSLKNVCLWFKHGFTYEKNENNTEMDIETNEFNEILKSINLPGIEFNEKVVCLFRDARVSNVMESHFKKLSKLNDLPARKVKKAFFKKLKGDREERRSMAHEEMKFLWTDQLELISRMSPLSREDKLRRLIKWAEHKGAQLNCPEIPFRLPIWKVPEFKFKIVSETKGIGAVALSDATSSTYGENHALLTTPVSIEISSNKIKNEAYFEDVAKYQDRLDDVELVILALCVETKKGEESEYWPYIDFLPKDLRLGRLNIPQKCLPMGIWPKYEELCNAKIASLSNVKSCSTEWSLNDEDIEWAYSITHSRYLKDGDNVSLRPIIDLLNASQNPQLEIFTQSSSATDDMSAYNVVLATENVKHGDELCISYGSHTSNLELWFYHGFTFVNNATNTSVDIGQEEFQEILESIGIIENIALPANVMRLIENDKISPEVEEIFTKINTTDTMTANIPKASQAKFDAFFSWLRDNGATISDDVEIRFVNRETGFGVFAKTDLKPNQIVLSIPHKLTISPQSALDVPEWSELLSTSDVVFNDRDRMLLYVCLEKRKGNDSFYAPYFDILPTKFYTAPMDIDLDDLPADARQAYKERCDGINELFKKVKTLIPNLKKDELLWANNVMNSRSFGDPSMGEELLPLIDMVNSSQEPQALTLSSNNPRHHVVRIAEKKEVLEGEELFVDYGFNLNNLELWMKHGFVFPENKHNSFVEIEPAELVEAAITLQLIDKKTLQLMAPVIEGALLTIIEERALCEDLNLSVAELLAADKRRQHLPEEIPPSSVNAAERQILKELRRLRVCKLHDSDPRVEFLWRDQIKLIDSVLQ
ncbi:hypothetical protein QR680_008397 [Steinernema hermaphroditum]|uniref:SET domain-containing protein n=1 Tax=Steinernema hermaphroditum TaxID=289476 RepID=A0AA39M807_9BILA|nr:hypothetical protein QR680_008397 [Steinernema hermaphroditum]